MYFGSFVSMQIKLQVIPGYLNFSTSTLTKTPKEVFISKRMIQFIMKLMHKTKDCSCSAILPWALIVKSYKPSTVVLPVAGLETSLKI